VKETRHKKPHIELHLYKMPIIGKSIDAKRELMIARG
jgi:hypothetical protein